MCMEHWWNGTERGELKYWDRSCHSASMSNTNLTWTNLGSNTKFRGDRPVTDSCHRVTKLYSCHHELVTHNCSATGRSVVACSRYCWICVSV